MLMTRVSFFVMVVSRGLFGAYALRPDLFASAHEGFFIQAGASDAIGAYGFGFNPDEGIQVNLGGGCWEYAIVGNRSCQWRLRQGTDTVHETRGHQEQGGDT